MSSNKAHAVAAAAEKKMFQLPDWLWPNSSGLSPLYKWIWDAVQEEHPSSPNAELLVDTNKIFPLLLTSQLSTEVLGYIWSLANQKYAGQLTEQELYVVLALVALAQASYPFNSLEVLMCIRTPPVPNLSLVLPENAGPRTETMNNLTLPLESSTFSSNAFSTANKRQTNLTKPTITAKLDSLPPRSHSHLSDLKEIKFLSGHLPDNANPDAVFSVGFNRQGFHKQSADIRHQVNMSYTVDNDEYSDFQSAPIVNNVSTIPNLWDSKQGSAIGSRLANHNLGVKKSNDKVKRTTASKNSSTAGQIRGLLTSSSPVTMHNKESQFNERLPDLFPKCMIKSQPKTFILKDTIIRHNDSVEVTKPITKDFNSNSEETVINTISVTMPKSTHARTAESMLVTPAKNSKDVAQQDLMNLRPTEDKYSALRALVNEPSVTNSLKPMESPSTFPILDDFGEFVSADQSTSTSSNNGRILVDLLSDYDFNTKSIMEIDEKSSPSLIQEISDAFNALACEVVSMDKQAEENYNALSYAEKIVQQTNALAINSAEANPLASEIITRSASLLSLNLKSFLPSSQEDEQHIDNMHQMIYCEWKQYMESCVLLLQVATNVFTSITSEIILREVLSSAQGYNFLCNLAEVAAVCRRVNFSHKEMDINIIGFNDLLVDIDRIWSEMEPFYTDIPIITELPAWPLCPKDGITCALCLTVISSGRVMWNNYSYHASCANLWLNTVSSNLPVLQYPISYMQSTITQRSNHA